MRELTEMELELVSGGDTYLTDTGPGPGGDPTTTVIVTAGGPGAGAGGGGVGGGGTGTGPNSTTVVTVTKLLAKYNSPEIVNNSTLYANNPATLKAMADFKAALKEMMTAAVNGPPTITMPDGTQMSQAQLEDFLGRIEFNLTDTDYGAGRAGANNIDPVTGLIVVDINAAQFTGYDADPGSMQYLIGHEIGHDTTGGIQESNTTWGQWLAANPGEAGKTAAQQAADYANSTQFGQNEKYANDVALAINTALGQPIMSNPQWGY